MASRRLRLGHLQPMHLAFMTCMGMCGNGWRIVTGTLILERQQMARPAQQVHACTAFTVAARGSTLRDSCALRTAAGARRRTGTTIWGSVSPEI